MWGGVQQQLTVPEAARGGPTKQVIGHSVGRNRPTLVPVPESTCITQDPTDHNEEQEKPKLHQGHPPRRSTDARHSTPAMSSLPAMKGKRATESPTPPIPPKHIVVPSLHQDRLGTLVESLSQKPVHCPGGNSSTKSEERPTCRPTLVTSLTRPAPTCSSYGTMASRSDWTTPLGTPKGYPSPPSVEHTPPHPSIGHSSVTKILFRVSFPCD
jgi:hypothetical protein